MKLENLFPKGTHVRYIPGIAEGDPEHPSCQDGVVSSTNDKYVFVKYHTKLIRFKTGDEPYTAQATKPEDLIILQIQKGE